MYSKRYKIYLYFVWYLLNKYYTSIHLRFKNIEWDDIKEEIISYSILLAILGQFGLGLIGLGSYVLPLEKDLGVTFIQLCRIVQYTWVAWIFIYLYIEWQNYKDHLRRIAKSL